MVNPKDIFNHLVNTSLLTAKIVAQPKDARDSGTGLGNYSDALVDEKEMR
jgi:hypothetical protein